MPNLDEVKVRVNVNTHIIGIILAAIALVLAGSYGTTKLIRRFIAPEQDFGLYRFFSLGAETSLPTYISALYMLFAGFLLLVVTIYERRNRNELTLYWFGLALGVIFMSFDESTEIHEGIIGPIFASFFGRGEGIWYYGWYIPFIPVISIVSILYISFLRRIPLKYTKLFILSGVTFIGGSVGVEMIQSYVSYYEIEMGMMSLSQIVEETCEMLGITILIYAILLYICENKTTFQLKAKS
jgi:hypothetical protein